MHFELTIEDMGPDKQIVIYAARRGVWQADCHYAAPHNHIVF